MQSHPSVFLVMAGKDGRVTAIWLFILSQILESRLWDRWVKWVYVARENRSPPVIFLNIKVRDSFQSDVLFWLDFTHLFHHSSLQLFNKYWALPMLHAPGHMLPLKVPAFGELISCEVQASSELKGLWWAVGRAWDAVGRERGEWDSDSDLEDQGAFLWGSALLGFFEGVLFCDNTLAFLLLPLLFLAFSSWFFFLLIFKNIGAT